MEASASKSGDDKGKEKKIDNGFEKRKQIWFEQTMKSFEKTFPNIQKDARLCRLIAAQYDAEEDYQTWLHKFGNDNYHDEKGKSLKNNTDSAAVEDQQNAKGSSKKCSKMAQ